MSVQPSSARAVGEYTLLARLGEGGMGVVHLARKGDGPRVALKVLRPQVVGDDEARRRLAREVGSLERIRSRWVAEIVDADPWAAQPYVATRYIPGLNLHEHVSQEGAIAGPDLRWFARCLAQGVASVHAAGVLHRDVKPSNVLLEGRTPILIDFGLARVADDPRITHTGWLLGTPGYLPPEILYGDDATAASDVHSWAATVAFAGTGHPPFGRGPAMAVMDRVRRGEHDVAGLPDDLRSIVSAALHPDPARRPSLDEIVGRLSGEPAPAPADDPFTLPLALVAQEGAAARTEVAPGTRRWEDETDPDDLPLELEPGPRREGPGVAARRGATLVLLAVALAAVLAGAPYWTLGVLLAVSWLLRTATLTVTTHGDRRRLRGARWYDVLVAPLSAPWYLVAAVPGALLLGLWSLGLGLAGVLLSYAGGLSAASTLLVTGLCVEIALWAGPGAGHVRWPVRVAAHALARRTGRWAVASAVLLAVAGFGYHQATTATDWSPFGRPAMVGR